MPPIVPVLHAAALALLLASSPARADKPHQHGVVQLDVAVENGRIVIDLDTPLENLLGFERAPRTDAERERAKAMVARLQAADTLFRIDGAAGCKLAKVTLDSAALGLGRAKASGKGDHAELEGRFEFNCTAAARAGHIEVGLFDAFEPLKRIELQLVLPRGQMKATLQRPASRVALAR